MINNNVATGTVRLGLSRSSRVLVGVVAVVVVSASGCRWAAFRGDAALSGYNGETVVSSTNGGDLVLQYSVAVGWSSQVIGTPRGIVGKTANGELWGADRSGWTGCSGTPKVCQPLWTAQVNTPDPWISLHGKNALTSYRSVTNGDNLVAAYNTVDLSGCSGAPKVCPPVWVTSGPSISGATIGGSLLYVTDGSMLRVYDAEGSQGCSGSPRVCNPLWTAPVSLARGEPMVTGGRVYVIGADGYEVFDAAGAESCSGTPKVCNPLWSANLGGGVGTLQGTSEWVVAVSGGTIQATDAKGVVGCAGTPKVCGPAWTASINGYAKGRPAIAQGKVLIQADASSSVAYAYDLAGVTNCTTGAIPHTCSPVWERNMGVITPTAFDTTAVNDVAFFERYDGTNTQIPDGPLYTQALRIDNGTIAFATPDGLGFMPPVVGEGRVYLQNPSGIHVLGLPG